MPDLIAQAADNPEFARVIELNRLRDLTEFDFDISPTPEEAERLARLMGARGVRKLRFAGRLTALGGGWELTGTLGATVIQTCVVTLDPVTSRVDQPVRRLFLPMAAPRGVDFAIGDEEDEDIEPLGDRIDLGLVAIEALALALPPYPRKEGAALASSFPGGAEETETVKPFAALAALRDKLDGGS